MPGVNVFHGSCSNHLVMFFSDTFLVLMLRKHST
jgi:hypothetical protein